MNRRITALIIGGILGLVFTSCNPQMEIPAYIYIEDVQFRVQEEQQGTSSSKIPSVFIIVDGKDIGCYQLPALIPVVANGQTKIQVQAGIKLNGITAQQVGNPFYTIYEEMVMLARKEIDTIRPTFSYASNVKFEWIEDFENAGLLFESISGANLGKTNDSSLMFHYGSEPNNFSGIIDIASTDSAKYFEVKSIVINQNANVIMDCFVEINYRLSHNVEVGLYCHSKDPNYRSRKIGIIEMPGRKDAEWNKVYINLTDELRSATTDWRMDYFEIYMKGGVPQGESGRFLFDNIKLVYR